MHLDTDQAARYQTVNSSSALHLVREEQVVKQSQKLYPSRFANANQFIKRFVDIIGGVVGLFLLAVVTPIIYWKIQRESPGPIFF
jgi:lipopolysaccharide/colanic/teichoic acid biosynthesis glycosyltransferase